MSEFSEDKLIEQTAIKFFGELWSASAKATADKGAENFVNAYSDEGDARLGRENQGQVVLMKYLKPALERFNPDVSTEGLNLAIDEIIKDRSAMSMVNANREVWQLLRDGVRVETENEKGEQQTETVKIIDFENPKENHFMLVSQLWVTGELHKRRPDLIGFVNGLPLVLIELKASHKNLRNAYQQNIRDYKDTIPQLFWYNAFIIISNGIESKVGTITGAYEHFNEWKKIKDEKEVGKVSLETVIKGTCEPARLLDIIENFILFDDSRGERAKAIARYFQFFGVNRAFLQVQNREKNKGRLGVFWHTQGSGKSYSMVFLSQKVFRKLTGNFTFVVVTDRKELDRQIYKTFAACGAVYENEVHADSVEHLKQLLKEDHRHVFTLIHKFAEPKELSNRSDVIVMADEAHRTQYDRMAANMRIALPKASFLGFTGTPLMASGEEKTREAFGDYVSTYNFAQSVKDGATVPLYYENRVPKLENVNPDIQKDLERVMNFYDLAPEEEEKLEQEFSTFYHLITREDRLNKVAEDIVAHFTARGYNGKAMVVSIDKKTAIRMHAKVKEQMQRHLAKLNIALSKAADEHEKEKIRQIIEQYEGIDMAVVVSQGQNEIADMEEFEIDMRPLRARMQNEDLETKFKDPDSNLRIVFVCAMWITGFDVLNLSTLYLDKPLKNHTLMQTIARANRVYPGKTNGLIVDYIGVFRNIQRALAIYATPESGASIDDIIKEKEALVELLVSTATQTRGFLKKLDLDVDKLLKAKDAEKIRLVDVFTNRILQDEQTKKRYLDFASDVYQLYKAVLPEPKAEDYYQEVMAFKVIASRIKEVIEEEADVSQVKKDLEDLLDRSIKAGEFVIKEPKLKDLSHIDFEALRKFFDDTENKNIAAESLSAELEEKIKEMARKNKIRKHFLDRLNLLINEYNSGSRDLDSFFEELLALAKELSEEDRRAIKENLTEEELAIFDLLAKENLNPDEVEKVKKVALELLAKLKAEKFVLDWKRKEETRADVKITIRDMLYDNLPEPAYSEQDCEDRTQKVYFHVYDNYVDAKINVYAQ
ncbi:MAG: type I restriction endonuclease subunit R [bacterium]